MDFIPMRDFSEFCEHLSDIRGKFQKWDNCERTVALYYLMSGLPFANARFLQHTLEHCIKSVLNSDLVVLEQNANDASIVVNMQWERPQIAVHWLLEHLPLLQPGNRDVAERYLLTIRKVIQELISLPNGRAYNECVELMSYVFVHPAFNKDDKKSFKILLKQMVGKSNSANLCSTIDSLGYSSLNEHSSDDSVSPNPENVNERMTRRSNSLTPVQSDSHESLGYSSGVWSSQENLTIPHKPRSYSLSCDSTVPPPSLTASSSDTRLHDLHQSQQPLSKGIVFWLKSLRLHKYSWVFANLNYEQMISLTDEQLQAAGITKGARHKLLINIAKLKERSSMLATLETDVLNGGDLSIALRKLKTILQSPLQANANEDLPSQFVKVMGKVCTQLLMVRHPPDDCLSQFNWLCDRADTLDAFGGEHRRRLAMWRSQLSRAGHSTSSTQRSFATHNNRHHNPKSGNYYGMTNKFQNNPQINNDYNYKSSSYPNMHPKPQCGSPRTSLNNLCPPPQGNRVPVPAPIGSSTNATQPTKGPTNPSVSICPPTSILNNLSVNPSTVQQSMISSAQMIRFNTTSNGTSFNTEAKLKLSMDKPINDKANTIFSSSKNVDIESSLENLCLQMMEHALGP